MTVRSRLRWIRSLVLLAASACASGPATRTPAAAGPTPAPVAPVPSLLPVAPPASPDTTVQPGRFDMGKMWTFENPPLDYFRSEYGFSPSPEWLNHVRLAALRLPDCSASFVSADGLVMSNHHCARESATAVSRPGEDLLTNGFYAQHLADERRVPDLYADELVTLRDVTADVEAGEAPDQAGADRIAARQRKIDELEARASAASKLRCEVTALYHGGRYSLYCYRRYTDVRLVFVPEKAIGYFGGDFDNFTYPRYDLDVSFFRVYNDSGAPLHPEAYFSWSDSGAHEGDPVFVIGNPGSTSRLLTVAQLEYRRDRQYPFLLHLLGSRLDLLGAYMDAHPATRPRLINDYFEISNTLKSFQGEEAGLRDASLFARKVAFQRTFKAAVLANPTLRAQYGDLWDQIAALRTQIAQLAPAVNALNQGGLLRSQTLGTALSIVRYGEAAASGAPDSVLAGMGADVLSATIDPALDAQLLAAQLEDASQLLGPTDPWVVEALAGRSPQAAAEAIVGGSLVPDSARRAALLGQPSDVAGSLDPAIRLMRDLTPRLRQVFGQYRSLQQEEEAKTGDLASALFAVYGTTVAPDATFTLRIADGVVRGYAYNGTEAPAFTTFYGIYDRHASNPGNDAWALPPRWATPPAALALGTPLDMVMTNDIIGGNSGSPVVNKDGRLVGIIFDGNIESLPGDFIYAGETGRAVAVHSAAILEALRHVYGAQRLVDELRPTATTR